MQGGLVVTPQNFYRFEGEYDMVMHSPYQLGDVLYRCGCCGNMIKREYITERQCPLCNSAFQMATLVEPGRIRITPHWPVRRRTGASLWILSLVMALLGLVPLAFLGEYISEAFFGLTSEWVQIITGILATTTAIIVSANSAAQRWWAVSNARLWLLGIPIAAPYVLWLAGWLTILIVQVILAIGAVILGLTFLIAMLNQ